MKDKTTHQLTGEGFKGYADLSHMETPEQKKAAEERLKKFTADTYREQKKKEKKNGDKVDEGTSYGIFRGSGKPSGQMSAFDKKKKDKDKDKKKAQVEEGITFLKKKKKESSSEYTRERDAGK